MMVTKSIGIYNGENEYIKSDTDRLIVEVATAHICLSILDADNKLIGFELFSFEESENEIISIFNEVENSSFFLKYKFSKTSVSINNECCLPVPREKYDESYAADYLNVIYGPDYNALVKSNNSCYENYSVVTLFRVSHPVYNELKSRLSNFELSHTFTSILNCLSKNQDFENGSQLHLQFYNNVFIVTVIQNGNFNLIQRFVYENPEDVLYHLLNIAKQFSMDNNVVRLHVSGIIDPAYKLFRELSNYFKNIVFEKPDPTMSVVKLNDYPLHYFTPFINLAL